MTCLFQSQKVANDPQTERRQGGDVSNQSAEWWAAMKVDCPHNGTHILARTCERCTVDLIQAAIDDTRERFRFHVLNVIKNLEAEQFAFNKGAT